MKIFADECVYQATTDYLIAHGFETLTAQEAGFAGCKNGELIRYAAQNQMVFLTRDLDFTDIRVYPPQNFHGIIALRISPENQATIHEKLLEMLRENPLPSLVGRLALIAQNKYRIV